jgi:hypothetical protein
MHNPVRAYLTFRALLTAVVYARVVTLRASLETMQRHGYSLQRLLRRRLFALVLSERRTVQVSS